MKFTAIYCITKDQSLVNLIHAKIMNSGIMLREIDTTKVAVSMCTC